MPPCDSPKTVDTIYSEINPSNGRYMAKARHCRVDPNNNTRNPPNRSARMPDTKRLATPPNSINDNICAPTAGPYPKSAQNDTIWTCGMDIATQHPIPAAASAQAKTLGGIPKAPRRWAEACSDF